MSSRLEVSSVGGGSCSNSQTALGDIILNSTNMDSKPNFVIIVLSGRCKTDMYCTVRLPKS